MSFLFPLHFLTYSHATPVVCWSCSFQCFIQRRAGGLSDAVSAYYASSAAFAAAAAAAAAARVVYINTDDADKFGEWVIGSVRIIAKVALPVCRYRNWRLPLAHSRHVCCW